MSKQTICKTNAAAFCAYVDAGMTLFPCVGYSKVPAKKGFLELPFDPEFIPSENNYGVLLKNRYLVIDCDPRQYNENEKPLTSLLTKLELPPDLFKQTFTVRTPRNGYHIYFKKPDGINLVNTLKEYPGLEFKTKFIMACGSFIDKSPKGEPIMAAYKAVFGSPRVIQACPQILLAALVRPDAPQLSLSGPVVPDNETDIQAFIQHCQIVQPAVEGKGGDLKTYQVACAGREFGLSPDKNLSIMLEHFNPRCQPPWDEAALGAKVHNAYEYATRSPQGVKSIQNVFPKVKAHELQQVKVKYQLDHVGRVKKCMHNLKMFFEYPVINDGKGDKKILSIPPIGNLLRYDQFSQRILWSRPAPWYKSGADWSDDDAVEFKSIVAEQLGLDFSAELIHEVAVVCASKRVFHPVRDYLDSCVWDGVPRVDTWLMRYCGALDSEYARYIGRKTLVAAVARVFAPGCKFDHVLTLEGAQGIGKSYMWEILASPWFTDAPLNIHDKSAVEILQGKWVVELAEMDALSKYESQTIKGFLSRTEDRCRMPYARQAKPFPRQNIFVGSINPEMTGWLRDRTGNRRYWPVAVSRVDIEGLKNVRDQLWAEALVLFRRGEQLYVADNRMREIMAHEVNSRMQEDPWFPIIEEYLHVHVLDHVQGDNIVIAPVELYMRCIGGGASSFRMAEMYRVVSALKTLGFTKVKSEDKVGYSYVKPYVEKERL